MAGFRRSIAVAALAAFLPVATAGCFGRFEAVRRVYDYNKEIHKDKWVVWVAFLVMSIVPIYMAAGFIDIIVFNSVEFWTGTNPMVGDANVLHGPGGELANVTYRADGKIDYEIFTAAGERHFVTLVRDANSVIALDEQGRFIARVGDVGGAPGFLPHPVN